jgi:hypothetical protein
MAGHETEYWFNMQTGEVEVGKQTLALYRIGPFEDSESAENALEIIAARSAAWADEEDDYSEKDSSGDGN